MSKSKLMPGPEQPLRPDESDLLTLDATLLLAMETAKDRAFILDIESLITSFIQNTQYTKLTKFLALITNRVHL